MTDEQSVTFSVILFLKYTSIIMLVSGNISAQIFCGVPFFAMLIMIKDLIVGGDGQDGIIDCWWF